ncbi:MAG: type VI secretion system-associated FHA domain protein TagH [Sandarakinorhabdus sp.]
MSCTLTIENVASLTSGDPVVMALNEHGLSIGRAAHADWTLPDQRNFISSLHCDIDFVDGQYVLNDRSTNGTFVNGGGQRLNAPHVLRDGDQIRIGSYEVRVALGASSSRGGQSGSGGSGGGQASGGLDWLAVAGGGSAPIDARQFGREAAKPLFQTSNDPLMAGFAPPPPVAAAPDPFGVAAGAPAADPFGITGNAAPRPNPFGLSSGAAPPMPAPPPAADPFGLSAPAPAPAAFPAPTPFPAPAPAAPSGGNPFGLGGASAPDPFGAGGPAPAFAPVPGPAPAASPPADNPWAKLHAFDTIDFAAAATPSVAQLPTMPPSAPAPAPAPAGQAAAGQVPAGGDGGQAYAQFLAAAGLKPNDLEGVPATQVLEAAGRLLRQATDGLIRLLDARTRIRHQFGVGAQVTRFQAQGNNPLKWTRVPEQALRQLVGNPDRGFLGGPQAVQGAFEDLQAHEVAMLAAMQEALAATVQRFSPEAIKGRAQGRGGILPGAKEAALWRAFETEYRALAAESDAAYLDLFARHFRTAYERNVKKD